MHELYAGDEPPKLIKDRLDIELGGILGKVRRGVYVGAEARPALAGVRLSGRLARSVGSSLASVRDRHHRGQRPAATTAARSAATSSSTRASMAVARTCPIKCPVCGTKYVKDSLTSRLKLSLALRRRQGARPQLRGEIRRAPTRTRSRCSARARVPRAGTIGTLAEKTALCFVKKYLEENGIAGNEIDRLTAGASAATHDRPAPGGLVVGNGRHGYRVFCPYSTADDPDSDTITTHFEYHCMDNLAKARYALTTMTDDDPCSKNRRAMNARAIRSTTPTRCRLHLVKVLGYEATSARPRRRRIPELTRASTRQMLGKSTAAKDFNTLHRAQATPTARTCYWRAPATQRIYQRHGERSGTVWLP